MTVTNRAVEGKPQETLVSFTEPTKMRLGTSRWICIDPE